MIRFFLTRVLSWAASVSWKDFILIVGAARKAYELFPKPANPTKEQNAAINLNRFNHVKDFILAQLPTMAGWATNLVLELAVAWFNREAKK